MAALEAMALRKAVIAGKDTPGVREVLGYGEAGVLINMTDSKELCGAMQRMAVDVPYRLDMAERGYNRAFSLYRTKVVFSQYEALYRSVLQANVVG
jgi:glycosyltransferase involved in cell wall biosynthesis